MDFKEREEPSRSARRTRGPAVKITPASTPAPIGLEVRRNGDWLEVTFAASDIQDGDFRYSVGKRYLLVWSEKGRNGSQHFIHLPHAVVPGEHILSFVNGVVDAKLRVLAS